MLRAFHLRLIFALILFMMVAGCGGLPPLPTAYSTGQAPTIIIPTRTPRPTATALVSPTPVSAVSQGTPFPLPQQVIAPDNAGRLVEFAHWGRGILQGMVWSADSATVAVVSTSGVALLAADTLAEIRFVDVPGILRTLVFSEDGSLAALGYQNGLVEIWDGALTGVRHTFAPNGQAVVKLAFSHDSTWLAVSYWDARVRIFVLADPENPQFIPEDLTWVKNVGGTVTEMAFNLDKDQLMGRWARSPLQFWRLPKGSAGKTMVVNQDAYGRYPSPGILSRLGNYFAAVYEGFVRIQRTTDGVTITTLEGFFEPISAAAFSYNQKQLATARHSAIEIWQAVGGGLQQSFPLQPAAASQHFLAFSPDGKQLAYYSDALRVWELESGAGTALEARLPGYAGDLQAALQFQPDGQKLRLAQRDGGLLTYSLPDGELLESRSLPVGESNGLVFSADAALLAAGVNRSQAQLWQTGDGSMLSVLESFRYLMSGMAFSPDGQYLAAPAADRNIVVFRLADAAVMSAFPCPQAVWKVIYSPDGSLLAALSNGSIDVFRAADGQLVYSLQGYSLAFAPDGANLVVSYGVFGIGTLRFHRASDGAMLNEVKADGGALAYSPDGSLLAVNNGRLEIRQATDGSRLFSTESPANYADPVFSKDGRMLALAAWDGRITLWGVP